jgi:hypothetical protein
MAQLCLEWFWYYWQTRQPNVVQFMADNYPPAYTYADFGRDFKAELFNATMMADIVHASGARCGLILVGPVCECVSYQILCDHIETLRRLHTVPQQGFVQLEQCGRRREAGPFRWEFCCSHKFVTCNSRLIGRLQSVRAH